MREMDREDILRLALPGDESHLRWGFWNAWRGGSGAEVGVLGAFRVSFRFIDGLGHNRGGFAAARASLGFLRSLTR
jgi:hypothetical protein